MFEIMIVVALFAIAFAIIFATLKICKTVDKGLNTIIKTASEAKEAYRDSRRVLGT